MYIYRLCLSAAGQGEHEESEIKSRLRHHVHAGQPPARDGRRTVGHTARHTRLALSRVRVCWQGGVWN